MKSRIKDEMNDALKDIISKKQISTVFQPIISLKDSTILGHEALSRITCDSIIKNTEELFLTANRYNHLWELEQLCRTTALEAAYKFMIPPYNKMLFINVNPNIMYDENFMRGFTKDFLNEFEIEPHNIIFEITERNIIEDMNVFLTTVDHYKGQNYKIAIDDAGAGYSGLNLISDVRPNYIKLDMKLIRNIDSDYLKYALVKGMVELSKASKINLIAEGIETYEELNTLVRLGVQYGQGYLIQKPCKEVIEINDEIKEALNVMNRIKNETSYDSIRDITIKNLCTNTEIVSASLSAAKVFEMLKKNPNFFGLCVVEEEIVLGIVTYEKLAMKMSGHFGYSLYQNKPISELMESDFLSVESGTPVSVVSYLAMQRSNDKLYDFIVVTENYRYLGTVTIKDLLQKATEIEVNNAKHQNPLSGLPGNIIVEKKLKQCVKCLNPYSIAYIDIDNFKAYNDVYGFENGDLVIQLLATILKSNIGKENFVGHIGGDDFAVIMDGLVTHQYFEIIVQQFEQNVLQFYNQDDINVGYITTLNRHGQLERYPLLTITCVVMNNQMKAFRDVFELTELLAKKKKDEKRKKVMF